MLSERLKEAKNEIFEKDEKKVFYERVRLLSETEDLFLDLPPAVRYGKTLEYILERVSVVIGEKECLVGRVKEVIPTEQEIDAAEKMSDRWWGSRTPEERQKDALFYYHYGWVKRRAPWFMSMGHLGYDWKKILSKGFDYYIENAEKQKKKFSELKDEDKKQFEEGVILCCRSFQKFIVRYADELKEKEKQADTAERKAALARIEQNCRKIAHGPAETLEQAMQFMWFLILVSQKVCGCGVFDLGRMDQYMYPYYKKDLAAGILTEQEALEIIEEFYLNNNIIMANCDHMSTESEIVDRQIEVAFDDPNYIIIGGLESNGKSAVNDLSFLFIQAAKELRLKNPFIVVRYHKGISPEFMELVCDAIRLNTTIVLYNDETMIPALTKYIYDSDDAYEYGFFGCNDPNLVAKEGGLRQIWLNAPKAMELALNEGDYPMEPGTGEEESKEYYYSTEDRMTGIMTGPYYGVKTQNPAEFRSMDDLKRAVREQLSYFLHQYRLDFERDIQYEKEWNRGKLRIEDCFLDDTVESGADWNGGGTKYHKIVMQICGLATVADSLAAIDDMVFRKHRCTMEELCSILKCNFKGHEDIQRKLSALPWKYGNDIDEADDYGTWLINTICDICEEENGNKYLYQYCPTISTDRSFTLMGEFVGATADGRRAGEPISENQSPVTGMDHNGIIALLNSVSKIPFNRITGGPLNLKLHPSSVKGEKGLQMLIKLLETYFEKGGMQSQINVVSKKELLEAQKNPQAYKSLCVRVTGYSAYFVQMNKKAQTEMIMRTDF